MNSILYEDHIYGRKKVIEEYKDIFIKKTNLNIHLIQEYYDSTYYYHIYKNQKLERQGWKIHLSCTLKNYQKVLDLFSDYAVKKSISFKHIYNTKTLNRYLSGDIYPTQLGKFITIYPTDTTHFIEVIDYLYKIFKGYEGPYILSDKRYKDSNIYYRYGVIDSDSDYLLTPSGELIEDNREYFSVPDFEHDPFECIEKASPISKPIIGGTVFPSSILYQSASGNVYDAVYDGIEVILKEARQEVLGVYGSAISDLKNEEKILNRLRGVRGVPKVLFSFKEWENYYLVEEKIPGTTITVAKADISTHPKNSIHNIFLSAIELIDDIHKQKVIVNDISSNNFILNNKSDKLLWICDFGGSYMNKDRSTNKKLNGITPTFYDSRLKNSTDYDSDFHKLGYVFMDYIFPFNRLNRYDLTGTLSLEKLKMYCELEGVNQNIYTLIELLITQPIGWRKEVDTLFEKKQLLSVKIKNKKHLHLERDKIYEQLTTTQDKLISGTLFAIEELSNDYYITNRRVDPYSCAEGLIIPTLLTNHNNKYSFPDTLIFGGTSNSNLGFLFDKDLRSNFYENFSLYEDRLYAWTNSNKDYSISSGYVGTGVLFLLADYNNECDSLDPLFRLIHKKVKNLKFEYEKDLNIGLIEGVLGVALFELLFFERTNNIEAYEKYLDIISNITKHIKKIDGELHFTEQIDSKISTPYIGNGMAGFILVNFYAYKSKKLNSNERRNIWERYISPFLSSIQTIRWAQNQGFLYGSLGISFVLFEIAKHTKNKNLIKEALETLLISISFCVEVDDHLFVFDKDKQYLSFDLENGSSGFLLVISAFLKYLRGEDDENIQI